MAKKRYNNDTVEQARRELLNKGINSEEVERSLKDVVDHPCRGCPSFVAEFNEWQRRTQTFGQFVGKPSPCCALFPTPLPDPGHPNRIVQVLRQVQKRCPFYGLRSIEALEARIMERVEEKVREMLAAATSNSPGATEPAPAVAGAPLPTSARPSRLRVAGTGPDDEA